MSRILKILGLKMKRFERDYRALSRLDITKDLDAQSIHISLKGIDWIPNPPPESLGLSPPQLLKLYYFMALTRRVDKEIASMSRKGLAFGKHLPATGNEATAVGASSALDDQDWLAPAIRDIGAFLVRGVPIEKILMQACGRKDGLTNGWDGSLHMGSKEKRIVGFISHLGTMLPIAVGCSFREIYNKTGNIALAFSGDGATSTGDIHEALNIASVMHLPLVVVVENNQWAFGTPNRLQFGVPTLALRVLGYGPNVEGYWIDGTNILTVYATVREAVRKARINNSITIIEAVSMRSGGHSLVDPYTSYVPTEQLEIWEKKDPIIRYKQTLIENGLALENELSKIDETIETEIRTAIEITERNPVPDGVGFKDRTYLSYSKNQIESPPPNKEGRKITYHEALSEAHREILKRDPSVFIIGEDIGISNGAFKITQGLSTELDGINWKEWWSRKIAPSQRRVIDAPLAEAGFCGLALGAVLGDKGLKAIVEFQYADFSSEAFKMIVNYAATQNSRNMGPVHVVFRMPSGWAPNTGPYHSINPESWYASTPGLKIVAPITGFDAKGLLKASVYDGNPVLFLDYKNYYRWRPETLPPELDLAVPEIDYEVPIGKARIVKEGKDISIITYGSQIFRVLEAVRKLEAGSKISIEVIDLRTILPYDRECVSKSVRKTSRALVTCEASQTGCFGNTIAHNIQEDNFDYLDAPVTLVAAADTIVPFSPNLEKLHLPTVEKLIEAIEKLLKY